MKCIAKMKAFYNGSIVNVGEMFEIDNCPDWAKPATSEIAENKLAPDEMPEEINFVNNEENNIPDIPVSVKSVKVQEMPLDDLDEKTPEELNTILDDLINEGIQANILLDGVENKSQVEQIRELRNLLGYKGE